MSDRVFFVALVCVGVLSWADWCLVGYAAAHWAGRRSARELLNQLDQAEARANRQAEAAAYWRDQYTALVGNRTRERLAEVAQC